METDAINLPDGSRVSALPPATGSSRINVGQGERIISVIGGVTLAVLGIKNFNKASGKLLTVAGSLLLKRGVTGYCEVNGMIGRDTADKKASAIEVRGTYTINRPREEVYTYWRNLQNLPRFMKHLEDVKVLDERRSSWTARVPGGIATVSWEAVIQDEIENTLISWSSIPGSTVDNAGEVHFKDAAGNKGTEIQALISYRLPAGDVGGVAGKLINPMVKQMVQEDLRRFKSLMETGEIPTTEGQPSARSKDKVKAEVLNTATTSTSLNTGSSYESPMLERH